MRQEILNDIKKDYQRKRLRSKKELQDRRSELYEMIPKIKTIDNTISRLSIEVSRLAFTRPENFETKMNQFMIDDSLFDIRNKELIEYVKSLAYSKATLIVSTENELNSEVVNASKISSTTIVMTESVPDLLPDYLLKNVSYNFLDFKSVINPDIKKISLL
jgi:hypothetical protein